jgi:stage II sporulation protein AA (anti-sigma F factor antagonist)
MDNSKRNVKQVGYMGLGAEMEIQGRYLIIHLTKELDHHNAVALREKSDQLIDKSNIKYIIFDFKNSEFMDSSGIGVIMGRYKKVIFTGGKVAVTNVNSAIDRIFHLTGLYKIIEKYESTTDALKLL